MIMKTEIEKVVKEKYPDNMKYGVEYQMDELRPEGIQGWLGCLYEVSGFTAVG